MTAGRARARRQLYGRHETRAAPAWLLEGGRGDAAAPPSGAQWAEAAREIGARGVRAWAGGSGGAGEGDALAHSWAALDDADAAIRQARSPRPAPCAPPRLAPLRALRPSAPRAEGP